MPIIRADQTPHFDLDGFHFRGFTSPNRGASELCTWQLDVDPGATSEAHRLTHEEVFVPLYGTLSIVLDGQEIEVVAGEAFAVPAHNFFQVANRSNKPTRALVCISANFRAVLSNGQEIGTPPWAQ